MKKMEFLLKVLVVSFITVFLFSSVYAQNSGKYRISITDPAKDGTSIYKICTAVKGTAIMPASDYLWVLVHRKDLSGQWWPQDGGIVRDNKFSIVVCLGQPQDIGMEFEIAAVTVTLTEHLVLQNYIKTARQTGNFYPISLPEVTSPALFRTVIKAAHQQ